MTPQEKREIEAELARLMEKVERWRERRRESDKRWERLLRELRELSGRA
jgi:hypothetical protein